MKKFLTILRIGATWILLLFAVMQANAQQPQAPLNNRQNAKDQIEALRIAFISQQLNLTPEEAQKFWPVYNAYRSESEALRMTYKDKESADQQLELEQKKLDLKRKYKPQFEAALGTAKLNQLYNLERKFQEKLKEVREQRQQQRAAGNRPLR